VRARKLRYYEDRRFTSRLLPPPALDEGDYPDRPPQRSHDWAGLTAAPVVIAAEEEEEGSGGGEGSLSQERHPGLAEEQALLPREPADPLGLGDDEDELAGAPLLARMLPLAPVVAADAINQGS